ncbi:zinc finger CCCH type motif-containing protein [Babesia ovis]|uniref:Zinc finger CCCH type motif-containing protein n=1 Tax=Babesia ovis TaxID=5869 RepID=A0A9W5T8N7_BABOV|nr:zinc finger CCCH type motif-containing protein [Babesia ovis]
MDFHSMLTETQATAGHSGSESTEEVPKEKKCNVLMSLALSVVKRESEKAALLKLKGYERADIERTRGKHSVVCRHWLKGMCMKGEFCDFLHQLVYSRMPPCRLFEKNGFCIDNQRGNCIFQHVVEQPESGAAQDPRIKEAIANGINFAEISHETDPDGFATAFVLAVATVFPKITDCSIMEEAIPPSPQDINLGEPIEAIGGLGPGGTTDDTSHEDQPVISASIPGLLKLDAAAMFDGNRGAHASFDINSKNTKCFMIKSNNMMNIYFSICYGIWATGLHNTAKLINAFQQCEHVILIFSGNESGGFQGYARMMTLPIPGLYKGIWGSFHAKLGENFRVKWIKQCSVEFEVLRHVTNQYNQNLPLKKSRDGTELPLDVAEIICNTLWNAPDDDLLKGTPMATWERIDHNTYFEELQMTKHSLTPGIDVAVLHLPIRPNRAPAKPWPPKSRTTENRTVKDGLIDTAILNCIVTTATHHEMALKYVSSYLLAVASGNENPSVADLKKILDSVGSEVDEECLKGLIQSMSGKTVHETIAAGMDKIQSMPVGGAAAPVAAAGAAAGGDAKAESKKAAAEPEEEEDDMGFSLFD